MALFLRLLDSDEKEEALAVAVERLRAGAEAEFEVDPGALAKVPGSPFAYWAGHHIRSLFSSSLRLVNLDVDIERGGSTMDDFRYVRAWWEVSSSLIAQSREATLKGCRWAAFAKGGSFSSYYRDWELVVDWARDGEILKEEISQYRGTHGWGYQWTAALNGYEFYFRPGISWARRTQAGLNLRVLPKGCIFSDKGPTIIAKEDVTENLWPLLGLMNSKIFRKLIDLQMAFGSYEVGVIQRTPVPNLDNLDSARLGDLALACVELKRNLDRTNEISHVFHLPALLQAEGTTLAARVAVWAMRVRETQQQFDRNQAEIDEIAFRLYGIGDDDRAAIRSNSGLPTDTEDTLADDDDEVDEQQTTDNRQLTKDLASYCVGCVFGRWDIRFATGERAMPELPDPFAPLPAYSPGMLRKDADALPTLRPDEDDILANDEGDRTDIVRKLRDALDLIWGDRAEAIERELCQMLDDRPQSSRKKDYELRDYFQKTGKGGFWSDHIQRHSKSRRKAPIYWLLQSPKGKYALWLYYPKLNGDTLAKALNNYVEPKLRRELERLASLRAEAQSTAGSTRRSLEREVESQEDLLNDIQEFRDRLDRVTRRGLRPDHNDGVLLTIAPLWELVPWSEAKRAWEELQAGKYEWSTVSKQLRGENVSDWEAIELDNSNSSEVEAVPDLIEREPRTVLGRLHLRGVGPAAELDLTFDERINILTGDNGLGKTFVLDAAWLVLTGAAPPVPLRPAPTEDTTERPSITYEVVSTAGIVQDENTLYFQAQQDFWDADKPQAAHGVLPRPGVVLYVRIDDGIAIWDRYKRAGLEKRGIGPALFLDREALWNGLRYRSEQLCRGAIEDLRDWWRAADRLAERAALKQLPSEDSAEVEQARLFDTLQAVLEQLSPPDEHMLLRRPMRVSAVDTTEYPQVAMAYGDVPVVYVSAAVRRILGLAYALVWAYDEHRRAAAIVGEQPNRQMIVLLDEIELHLHPKWQRRILPALLTAAKRLDANLHVQIITTTHAPLVLASMEPYFDEDVDQLFDFDLADGQVKLYRLPWANHGETGNWLTSTVFDLKEARSLEAEQAIKAAEALMVGEDPTTINEKFTSVKVVQEELTRSVPEGDAFWDRWLPYVSS